MSTMVASLFAELNLRDNATAGLQRADNLIDRVGTSFGRTGQQVTALGGSLTALTAPLTAFGATGVRTAMSYEDALKEIEVRAGATADEIAEIDAKARSLGQSTQFGPAQVADGMLQLMAAGQSASEAMTTIDAVLMGASASGAQMGDVGNSLTNVMNAFNVEVGRSNEVMQHLISSTATSSNTFSDVAQAFSNIGPVARDMGLDIEETAAVFSIFANNGIEGAEAGTQLRSMLTNMTRDVPKVQDAWDELGVSLYDQNGNMRDLNDVIQDMNAAMDGMSDENRNRIIKTLAGTYGQMGLSSLLAADGTEAMVEQMRQQADIADVASSRMSTFSGAVRFLQGSVELLQVNALRPLMDNTLAPMIHQVAGVVNAMSTWIEANPALAEQITRVLALLTVVGPTLMAVGTAMTALGPVIGALGTALGILTGPVGLVVAAIAGLGIAWQQNLFGMRDILNPFVANARTRLTEFGGHIMGLGPAFSEMWAQSRPHLDRLKKWFVDDTLPDIVDFIEDDAMDAVDELTDHLGGIWQTSKPYLTKLRDWFLEDALPESIDFVRNQFIPTAVVLGRNLIEIWQTASPYLSQFADWFTRTALPSVVRYVGTNVVTTLQSATRAASDIWLLAQPHLQAFGNWFLYTGLPGAVSFVQTRVIPVLQMLTQFAQRVWTQASPQLMAFARWFTGDLSQAMSFIQNRAAPVIESLIQKAIGIYTRTAGSLSAFRGNVRDVMDRIEGYIDDVRRHIDWMIDKFDDAVDTVRRVKNSIDDVIDRARDAVNAVSSIDLNPFNGLSGRAAGGAVNAGMPYVVGEQRPEVFVPDTTGTILPSTQGIGAQNIQINVYQQPGESGTSFARRVADELTRKGL